MRRYLPQNTGTSDSKKDHSPPRLNELEALISMAEEVAGKIDALTEIIAKHRSQTLSQTLFIYGTIFGSATGYFLLKDITSGSRFIVLLLGAVLTVVFAAFIRTLYGRQQVLSRIRRELMIEYQIQDNLISLIDQQIKRVTDDVSPVHLALFDIRVRRLERRRINASKI